MNCGLEAADLMIEMYEAIGGEQVDVSRMVHADGGRQPYAWALMKALNWRANRLKSTGDQEAAQETFALADVIKQQLKNLQGENEREGQRATLLVRLHARESTSKCQCFCGAENEKE